MKITVKQLKALIKEQVEEAQKPFDVSGYLGGGKFAPGSHVREIEAMPKMSTKQRLVFLIDELEYAHERGDTDEQHKLRLEIDHLIDFSL